MGGIQMAMELRAARGEGFATIAADGRVRASSWKMVEVVKAKELSGQKGLLFRRNSQSGALEATRRKGNWGGLNAQLRG